MKRMLAAIIHTNHSLHYTLACSKSEAASSQAPSWPRHASASRSERQLSRSIALIRPSDRFPRK